MNLYQPTITGSLSVSGSINISGSINVVGGGGTITGTASYATNAELLDGLDSTVFTLTSSFAAFTASQNILNGTYATTGSNTFAGIQTVNSNLVVTGSITAQTLVVQTITSSVDFVTGSTRFGSTGSNTHQFTGSILATGSLTLTSGSDLTITDGNVYMRTTNNGNRGITRYYDASNTERLQILGNANGGAIYGMSGSIQFFTNGAAPAKMTLQTDGTLGIGITSPTILLHVYTSSANTSNVISEFWNGDYTSETRNFIRVRNAINVGSTMSSYFGQGQNGKTYIISNDLSRNDIVIDGNNGNVGIGTSNPSVSLDVSAKTDGVILPVGTTAQRPTAASGLFRYNVDLQSLETYIANNWVSVQTTANNSYGWRRPSTFNIGGTLADGDRTWYSEINTANSYSSVVLNHVFIGNFTVVASWQRDFMGMGMLYKSGATLLDFNGYSADGNGPYFGGASVSGMSIGTYNSYSYLGYYAAPTGGGGTSGTKYFFKWQRSGNSLTMQYNTTGPYAAWTNFSSGASATCSSGDYVIIGAGEASGTENDPLRLIYVIGN